MDGSLKTNIHTEQLKDILDIQFQSTDILKRTFSYQNKVIC